MEDCIIIGSCGRAALPLNGANNSNHTLFTQYSDDDEKMIVMMMTMMMMEIRMMRMIMGRIITINVVNHQNLHQ